MNNFQMLNVGLPIFPGLICSDHVGVAGGGRVERHHQVGEAVQEERVGGGLGLCLQCPGQGYGIEKHG